ncbi:hypothetical protein LTR95_003958 [Oleoguttula sp. CCFEE 5521]
MSIRKAFKLQRSKPSVNLLDLPGEIRNLIYEVCLDKTTDGIDLPLVRQKTAQRHDRRRALIRKMETALGKRQSQLSLLQTYTQIYNKAKHLVWHNVGITFFALHGAWRNDPNDLDIFIRNQHVQRRVHKALRDIGHHFEHVQRLEIVGFSTLALILAPPLMLVGHRLPELILPAKKSIPAKRRKEYFAELRTNLNGTKDASHLFCRAIPQFKHLAVFDKCSDDLAQHIRRVPWLVFMASDAKCHWLYLRVRFPQLDTLHLRNFEGTDPLEQYEFVAGTWRIKSSSEVLEGFGRPRMLNRWMKSWRASNDTCPLLWM